MRYYLLKKKKKRKNSQLKNTRFLPKQLCNIKKSDRTRDPHP